MFLLTWLKNIIVVGILLSGYTYWLYVNQMSAEVELLPLAVGTLLISLGTALLSELRLNPVRRLTRVVQKAVEDDAKNIVFPEAKNEVGALVVALRRILRRRQRLLKKRERARERLMVVLEHLTDGIIILNKSGSVRLLNPAAERLLQTSMSQARDSSFIRVVRDHRMAELWKKSVENGQEESQAFELSDDRFVRMIVTPFREGVARGYMVVLQDFTELHYLQRVRQDFVSNVSHELRTPLASLRALAETLNDGALDDPPAARRFLERIEVEVDALAQMVQELLDLSRIESGKASLNRVLTATPDMITTPTGRLLPQAQRASVCLSVNVPDDLPSVFVDKGRIQQVVINLVHNAIKFTPPEGEISVSAWCDGDYVVVSVVDTGAGIPEEDLPRIFERFYKSDRARSGGGTGLGLAIAKHIVQAHGGAIWVESVEGRGSAFYFSLPRSQEIAATPAQLEQPETNAHPKSSDTPSQLQPLSL